MVCQTQKIKGYKYTIDERNHVICEGEDLGSEEEILKEFANVVNLINLFRKVSPNALSRQIQEN